MNYIEKSGFPSSITKHINALLILNDIYINNPIMILNIKLNSYIVHYLEWNQLSQSFNVNYILEVFYEKIHEQRYTEFNRLDKYIRQVFNKNSITKRIYKDRPRKYVNRCLANLIIHKQLLIWDKNDIYKFIKIYLTSKYNYILNLSQTPLYLNSSCYLLQLKPI